MKTFGLSLETTHTVAFYHVQLFTVFGEEQTTEEQILSSLKLNCLKIGRLKLCELILVEPQLNLRKTLLFDAPSVNYVLAALRKTFAKEFVFRLYFSFFFLLKFLITLIACHYELLKFDLYFRYANPPSHVDEMQSSWVSACANLSSRRSKFRFFFHPNTTKYSLH